MAESRALESFMCPSVATGPLCITARSTLRGRYIIMGDGDDSYDFSRLDPFVEQLRVGVDLVMGNRFLGGIAAGPMPWKNKHIGNPVLSASAACLQVSGGGLPLRVRGFARAPSST